MDQALVERVRRLRKRNETWQGGLLRLPKWVTEEGRRPFRPWLGVWVNMATGQMNTSTLMEPSQKGVGVMLEAMTPRNTAAMSGYRPSRVEVGDAGLAEELRGVLGEDTEVVVVEELPAVEQVRQHMRRTMVAGLPPDMVGQGGVTAEQLRSFAEAAEAFYRAAPWKYLSDEDLIRVEAPAGDEALSHLTVLGAEGRTFGVAFFRSPQQNAELQQAQDMRKFDRKYGGVWTIRFGPIITLATGDADYWEDGGFPAAGDNAYPQAGRFNSFEGKWERPDAGGLAHMQAVLLALAETCEEEMDRGRWQKGDAVLALPALLGEALPATRIGTGPTLAQIREMERALARLQRVELDREFATAEEAQEYLATLQENVGPQSEERPKTVLEQAEDLVDQAAAARGRRRMQLIRRALELCPDCPDAYLHLAYRERNLDKALPLFEKAVDAARRSMGEGEMEEHVGEFWTRPDTRPYMRARMGLGECLRAMGRTAEAVTQFNEMLRLNPQDNQGARFRMLACLLDLKRDSEAGMLVEAFPDERSAVWRYGKALLAFRRQGDTNAARKELDHAFDANYMAAAYLMRKNEMPPGLPASHRPGTEDEAVVLAAELMGAWDATAGAGHWLAEQRRKRREREERKRKDR